RMQLSKENAAIACGNVRVGFGRRAHTRKFFRRHDQKKLVSRFRKNDEFLGLTASPARGNGDPILLVDEVTKLAGVEALVRRIHWRGEMFAILTHFSPLLTTFRASRQYKIIAFFSPRFPHLNCAWPAMSRHPFSMADGYGAGLSRTLGTAKTLPEHKSLAACSCSEKELRR